MAKAGNKGRKIDRNRKWCEAYRGRSQRERNKALKLLRHLKRQGRNTDAMAVHCFNNLPSVARGEVGSLTPVPTLHKRIAPQEAMPPVRAAI